MFGSNGSLLIVAFLTCSVNHWRNSMLSVSKEVSALNQMLQCSRILDKVRSEASTCYVWLWGDSRNTQHLEIYKLESYNEKLFLPLSIVAIQGLAAGNCCLLQYSLDGGIEPFTSLVIHWPSALFFLSFLWFKLTYLVGITNDWNCKYEASLWYGKRKRFNIENFLKYLLPNWMSYELE